MNMTNFVRTVKLVTLLLATTALVACATATGPAFSGVEPTAADQGNIYLYRVSGLYASGAAFTVSVDGKPTADLPNASYVRLRMLPRNYMFNVNPDPLTNTSDLSVKVEPGKSSFYQCTFISNVLANVFFLGSAIEPREEAKALVDLKELKASK
jgi:hypothetical protein